MRIVLGIGNRLFGDDGVGIHVVQALQSGGLPADVECIDGGTLSFTLAEVLQCAQQLIVVDATELQAPPGTVRVFDDARMDEFVRSGPCSSVHEVGLAELLDMARLLDRLPPRRALVGIQPGETGWAESPSPAVASAIPEACRAVQQLLAPAS